MEKNSERLVLQDFEAECERAFGFLLSEYKFSGPEIDISIVNVTKLIYFSSKIAIECILDTRDQDVSVKVAKLQSGKLPKYYNKDEQGNIVRDYLTQLLLRQGVRDFRFDDPIEDSSISERQKQYRKALNGYARLLRNYCQSSLRGTTDLFDKK